MQITNTKLSDVLLIQPNSHNDNRGSFMESFRLDILRLNGIDLNFVQDNIVDSMLNVLRGMHFQIKQPQGKLIQVLDGQIFDVAVDIRKKSKTFSHWVGEYLSYKNKKQLYIPPGFAHGYCVVSKKAKVLYKCTDYYNNEDQNGIIWNDSKIDINWPVKNPILSAKDSILPELINLRL